MRLIPGDTKVKLELFKGVRVSDLAVGLVLGLVAVYVFISTMPYKIPFLVGIVALAGFLMVRITDGEPTYERLLRTLRYLVLPKHFERVYTDDMLYEKAIGVLGRDFLEEYGKESKEKDSSEGNGAEASAGMGIKSFVSRIKSGRSGRGWKAELGELFRPAHLMDELMPFTGIRAGCIEYGGQYFGAVLAIDPVEYRFMSDKDKTASIEWGVGAVLRSLPPRYAANIIKLDRPIRYDDDLECAYDKLEALRLSFEKNRIDEAEYKVRVQVEFDRIRQLRELCYRDKILSPSYYIALFDKEQEVLIEQAKQAVQTLAANHVQARRLGTMELAVFLKYTNGSDFEERDIAEMEAEDITFWAMPEQVQVRPDYVEVGSLAARHYLVRGYPSAADNAWLTKVMEIPATKVVVKARPVDRDKAVRDVDRSLEELKGRLSMNNSKESRQLELAASIESLSGLLELLQEENETLLEVNIFVAVYEKAKGLAAGQEEQEDLLLPEVENLQEMVRRIYRENGFTLSAMKHRQLDAFVGAQVSAYDPIASCARPMPSNTVAAMYPWINPYVSDMGGMMLGRRGDVPVCIDFFRRDSERVNSNMVIIGKSGSGKSYAAKSLLANLASEDAKIFILDPENEYATLAENLHGRLINVGNASQGRINPFHIMTDLDDADGESGGASSSYAQHMQFLEEFLREILPDCDRDALEYLSTLVERAYAARGIFQDTDLSRLSPGDYPTFDDVYDQVLLEFEKNENEYLKSTLRTLINYVGKFAEGGRNAGIWNGPSTITAESNFTVFNFQSLLAGRNETVANAQMLLVLKFINHEIIKNRDYNERYGLDRKVVVVIDEAHVFIDSRYPIALDFMYQLAKRIRKYNGMQIVITQNIKDFMGNEQLVQKSAAIINACQYSLIFPLAASDITDLCALYEKAGGINEQEQEEIQHAPRGQAFMILSPQSRSSFLVDVGPDLSELFEKEGCENGYFVGRVGREKWEQFVRESRARNIQFREEEALRQILEEEEEERASDVIAFSNISFSVEGEEADGLEPIMIDGKRLVFGDEAEAAASEAAAAETVLDTASETALDTAWEDAEFEETFVFGGGVNPPADEASSFEAAPAASFGAASSFEAASAPAGSAAPLPDGEKLLAMLMGQEQYERMIASIRERIVQEVEQELKA